jgi:hypothetical protein
MIRHLFALLALLLFSCSGEPRPDKEQDVPRVPAEASLHLPLDVPQVEDNLAHDSLVIQTTFALEDGSFIMVASHAQTEERLDAGDRNAGLRLYRYRLMADGKAEVMAASSSAHDSWTMFPTFFRDPHRPDARLILANFGARDSWGQRVLRMTPQGFEDIGFMQVAALERVAGDEGEELRARNVASYARVTVDADGWRIRFGTPELILFDDLRGGTDVPMAGTRVHYRWSPGSGLVLYVDDEARLPAA